MPAIWFFVFCFLLGLSVTVAQEPILDASQWDKLQCGQCVLLGDNPCLPNDKKDSISGAILIDSPKAHVWNFVGNPQTAPSYIDNLVSSRVVSQQPDFMLVAQQMKVKGFLQTFNYRLRMIPTKNDYMTFQLEEGKFRALEGGYWLYPRGAQTLIIYSILLDPGFLAPKSMVRGSLKRIVPETLAQLKSQVEQSSRP